MGWFEPYFSCATSNQEFYNEQVIGKLSDTEQAIKHCYANGAYHLLWKNTENGRYSVDSTIISNSRGVRAYKHIGIDTRTPVSLIRECIELNRQSGTEKALEQAASLEKTLIQLKEWKTEDKGAKNLKKSILDEVLSLHSTAKSCDKGVYITLLDGSEVLFLGLLHEFQPMKRKSSMIVYRTQAGERYKTSKDYIKSFEMR